jgi:hypothetical protein
VIRLRTRNFYELCCGAVLKKVSKDESSAIFLNNSIRVAKRTLSSQNLLNMAFLRFLLVFNVNERAWRPA